MHDAVVNRPLSQPKPKPGREASSMTANSKTTPPEGSQSPWPGLGKFLFIAIFTGLLFLLANSMVRHHFHQGGELDRHERVRP